MHIYKKYSLFTYNEGCFTLWLKIERLSISTNQVARKQEFGLSTLHTRGQSPKARRSPKCLYGRIFWPRWWTLEGSLGRIWMKTQTMVEMLIFFIKKWNFLTRSWPLDWRDLFRVGNKVGCTFFLWTLGLAFGSFTLCPAKGSNAYILWAIYNPFLWNLNKVWPFNPTVSQLGQP
jgi:hypothetical protein